MHIFEFGKPCGLLVDASNIAVGCCLIQWTEVKREKPIAFASCKLTATQSAMSTIQREAFAVIYALRKFRNFVFATEVTIFSDHNPLMYLRECAPKRAWGSKNSTLFGRIGLGVEIRLLIVCPG